MTSTSRATVSPRPVTLNGRLPDSSSRSLPTNVTLRRTSKRPTKKSSPHRLLSIAKDISAIDLLMIRHGQLECGSGARPIVPRCMTALPENISDFLESLLPCGG
ncbi:MAG: hypothetical protein RIR26_1395 [Pseudomonadota bacterium]|jgi:hypothetical protein